MENIDFLKKVLMSSESYWIAARMEYKDWKTGERDKDSIWVIAVPITADIRYSQAADEIRLKDIERLRDVELHNIAISESYPPFQHSISMRKFYQGFPITGPIKDFVIKALQLGSNNIYDYEQLLQIEATTV